MVYLSPTVRLFGWPSRIEGVEKTLAFIALSVRGCREVVYRPLELAVLPDRRSAFVHVHFDWDAGDRRLRSNYVVLYRYRDGRIGQQEIYYDPDGTLEELPRT